MDCQLDRKMIARLDSTKHNCVSVTHLLWHTVLIYWIYCINQLFRCVFQVETHKITLGIQNSENPKFAKIWVGHLKSKLYFGNYLGNFRNPKLWKHNFLPKKLVGPLELFIVSTLIKIHENRRLCKCNYSNWKNDIDVEPVANGKHKLCLRAKPLTLEW